MPKASVIVPVYKVEAYLPRCIESILNQTYTDFELILIDDGSPDDCGSICDKYATMDNRIRVLHKENEGVAVARNAGIDISQGEYIAFCDSDDHWDANFLKTLLTVADQEQRDLVSCTYRRISTNKKENIQHIIPASHILLNNTDRIQYLHEILLQGKEGWEIWTRIFRASVIHANNIRFCTTCGNFAEDLEFVARFSLYAKSIQALNICLYNYTVRDGSMMYKSQQIVRLNELNEVSCSIGSCYNYAILGPNWKKYRAVTHYMVMYCQYSKIFAIEKLSQMQKFICEIKNKRWFKVNTLKIFTAYGLLKSYIGKDDAIRVIMFSSYCLHNKWWIYRITRGLYNKIFGYRQR